MKDEVQIKYVPPSFSTRLMKKWNQYTQGNKSTKEYVVKFDEFLIKYNTLKINGQD